MNLYNSHGVYGCLLSNLKINYKIIIQLLLWKNYKNGMTNKMKLKKFDDDINKIKNKKDFTSITTVSVYDVRWFIWKLN